MRDRLVRALAPSSIARRMPKVEAVLYINGVTSAHITKAVHVTSGLQAFISWKRCVSARLFPLMLPIHQLCWFWCWCCGCGVCCTAHPHQRSALKVQDTLSNIRLIGLLCSFDLISVRFWLVYQCLGFDVAIIGAFCFQARGRSAGLRSRAVAVLSVRTS